MIYKKSLVIAALIFAVFSLSLISTGCTKKTATDNKEQNRWRFSTVFPSPLEGDKCNNSFAFVCFADKLAELTDGQIKIDIGWGNSMGFAGPDILRSLKAGRLEIAEVVIPFHEVEVPWFGILSITNLSKGPETTKAMYQALRPMMEETFEQYDTVLLAFFPQLGEGSQVTLWTNREIQSLSDFKGMKVRGFSTIHAESILEKLGASVVWIPTPEIYTSIKTGVVDSVTNGGIGAGWVNNLVEVVDYAYEFSNPIPPIGFAIGVNRNVFDGLSPELQEAVLEAGRQFEEYAWGTCMDPAAYGLLDREGLQNRLDTAAGLSFSWRALPAAMMDEFYLMSLEYLDRWAAKTGPEGERAKTLILEALEIE